MWDSGEDVSMVVCVYISVKIIYTKILKYKKNLRRIKLLFAVNL